LKDNVKDGFYEPNDGIPHEYVKVRDSNIESSNKKTKLEKTAKTKKKKPSFSTRCYNYNNGGICTEKTDNLFTLPKEVDSRGLLNAYYHKQRANVRISTRPQKFFKPPEVSTDFYYENFEVFSEFPEFDLANHVVVGGCFDTNRHTIQQQIGCKNFTN
jgi:hypothetical protein